MTKQQRIAIANPCYLGFECAHPRYRRQFAFYSVIITVNAGYE